jgi:hypothetical protein
VADSGRDPAKNETPVGELDRECEVVLLLDDDVLSKGRNHIFCFAFKHGSLRCKRSSGCLAADYTCSMQASRETALKVLRSGLPWLGLELSIDHSKCLSEAEALSSFFQVHRSIQGWSSVCLHGISASHTESAMSYGFDSEAVAPHCWTEIAVHCPVTTEWVKKLPLKQLFRVRFMLLEPGKQIPEHRDQINSSLGPINVALNNPIGCSFDIAGVGCVPFEDGRAFLIDVSRPSGIGLNPAIRDRVKSGHREWPKT